MAKTTYASMKLKVQTQPKEIEFEGNKINILQYLPLEAKYDLVMITLQKCEENGIYNPIKKDMFFHLFLVYMYTDIVFTDKQKEDEVKLYDTLESNGLITEVVKNIPEEEYNKLFEYMDELIKLNMTYKQSAGALISSFINDLPKQAETAAKIVEQFDASQFQQVLDFAKAANGGRDIQ